MNTLREALQEYIDLRRGLGYKMHDEGLLLPRFVGFMEEHHADHITVCRALEWAQCASVQPAEWARRLCFVRGFSRHRSATDSRTEIPPLRLLPHRSSTRVPEGLVAQQPMSREMNAHAQPLAFACAAGHSPARDIVQPLVTEQDLDDSNIDLLLQQVGGKAVAQPGGSGSCAGPYARLGGVEWFDTPSGQDTCWRLPGNRARVRDSGVSV